jgi:hypothetical protein
LQRLSPYQKQHVFYQLPSLLEYFGFVFAFGNLLAGPVIEFRDYQQWVNSEGVWAKDAKNQVPLTGDLKAVSGRRTHTQRERERERECVGVGVSACVRTRACVRAWRGICWLVH